MCTSLIQLGFWRIKLTAGLPGYSVFSNLYLNGGILYAVSADETAAALIPETRTILSGVGNHHPAAGPDRWSTVIGGDLARSELGNRAVRLPGVTVSFAKTCNVADSSTSSTTRQERRATLPSTSTCSLRPSCRVCGPSPRSGRRTTAMRLMLCRLVSSLRAARTTASRTTRDGVSCRTCS